MFENTNQLAENKLIILYILNEFKMPINKSQLIQFILENDFMNYFLIKQYLPELSDSKLIELNTNKNFSYYLLTQKGKQALGYFEDRLLESSKLAIKDSVEAKTKVLLKESEIVSNYMKLSDSEYLVSLMAIEHGSTLIDLKINVVTAEQAKQICKLWKEDASRLYRNILELFMQ